MPRPPMPRRGQPVTAEFTARWYTHLANAARVIAGFGLRSSVGPDGSTVLSLDRQQVRTVPGFIVAAPPANVPVAASACRYSARGYDPWTYLVLTDVLPVYGRPVSGDAPLLLPAQVGQACVIHVRESTTEPGVQLAPELEVLSERVSWAPCPQ